MTTAPRSLATRRVRRTSPTSHGLSGDTEERPTPLLVPPVANATFVRAPRVHAPAGSLAAAIKRVAECPVRLAGVSRDSLKDPTRAMAS